MEFRYIDGVATLKLDALKCVGCGMCEVVCPHRIFKIRNKKAIICDKDRCIESGACANNCPAGAISVTPGTGCAYAIMDKLLGNDGDCCC